MQLPKNSPFEDNSLFGEQLLLHEPGSPHRDYVERKVEEGAGDEEHVGGAFLPPSQLRFYQEFRKIYTVSHHLTLEKRRQFMLLDGLAKRIKGLEERMRDVRERETVRRDPTSQENRAKRSRRTAQQIQKKFKCEVVYCQRLYGSQGSLQQHIKLKHPQLYQKSQSECSQLLQGECSV